MISTRIIEVEIEENGIVDITAEVEEIIREVGVKEGIAVVFNIGSTGAISTMEYEPGLKKDIPIALERLAPRHGDYHHHATWGDDNGSSHVRATVVGPGIAVPFHNGKLLLGTWQQIVVMNFDTRRRKRKIAVQIIGE